MATSTIKKIGKPYTTLELTNPNSEEIDNIAGYTENGMVVLFIKYKSGLQGWASPVTVSSLLEKYRPRQKINGVVRYDSSSDVRAVFSTIDPNGTITAFLNTPALVQPVTFSFVYPERT